MFVCALAAGVTLAWWWRSWFRPKPNPQPEVVIQDGKTIDFSSGKPVVKDSAAEKAAIDAAVKEMDTATKDIKFGPTKPPPATVQPAESPPKK